MVPGNALPSQASVRHIPLPGRWHVSLLLINMGHATNVGTPLAQSTDSSPRSCPGNIAPWLSRCGQKMTRAWAQGL
jgi:hypothetical protein